MEIITKEQMKSLVPLVHRDYSSVQLGTVLEGCNPGFAYVDEISNPQCAMVFHQGEEGFYFLGNPQKENFNRQMIPLLKGELKEKMLKAGLEDFEFSGDSPQWDQTFQNLFSHLDMWHAQQLIYLDNTNREQPPFSIPEGVEILNVTNQLCSKNHLENIPFLENQVNNWWDSWEDFLARGGGFIAVMENRIIGRCVSDGLYGKRNAIDIAVEDAYRKRGIATALAGTFISWMREQGQQAYWECSGDNTPSIKLAEKWGLELSLTYSIHGFSLDKI